MSEINKISQESDSWKAETTEEATENQTWKVALSLQDDQKEESLGLVRVCFESLMADQGSVPMAELACVLSFLRVVSMVHQTHHWQTRGQQSYGDHLLFERLYNESEEGVDPIAEKTVGLGEHLLVRPCLQADQVKRIMYALYGFAPLDPEPTSYVQLSYNAELAFLSFVDLAVESLKARDLLSRGIDNLLADIQDRHEGHVYLLSQRLKSVM